jgi:hypothetical protein
MLGHAFCAQRPRKEINEGQMTIKCNPNSLPSRYSALSRLQIFLTVARKAPKSILQIRWERRWTAASGAWFAVLVALLLGGIDWRAAVMVAATTFMLARSGDMLDDYDE